MDLFTLFHKFKKVENYVFFLCAFLQQFKNNFPANWPKIDQTLSIRHFYMLFFVLRLLLKVLKIVLLFVILRFVVIWTSLYAVFLSANLSICNFKWTISLERFPQFTVILGLCKSASSFYGSLIFGTYLSHTTRSTCIHSNNNGNLCMLT